MSVSPEPPYRGEGVNFGHALHEALEDAEARDPEFKARREDEAGKFYEVSKVEVEAGNSHVHTFRVELT